uniref:Uncharacterized protein n=1 Tax=Anguilla anguilla TaxID=7936 RepID=A0A0E9VK84_ANGAN
MMDDSLNQCVDRRQTQTISTVNVWSLTTPGTVNLTSVNQDTHNILCRGNHYLNPCSHQVCA